MWLPASTRTAGFRQSNILSTGVLKVSVLPTATSYQSNCTLVFRVWFSPRTFCFRLGSRLKRQTSSFEADSKRAADSLSSGYRRKQFYVPGDSLEQPPTVKFSRCEVLRAFSPTSLYSAQTVQKRKVEENYFQLFSASLERTCRMTIHRSA